MVSQVDFKDLIKTGRQFIKLCFSVSLLLVSHINGAIFTYVMRMYWIGGSLWCTDW